MTVFSQHFVCKRTSVLEAELYASSALCLVQFCQSVSTHHYGVLKAIVSQIASATGEAPVLQTLNGSVSLSQ